MHSDARNWNPMIMAFWVMSQVGEPFRCITQDFFACLGFAIKSHGWSSITYIYTCIVLKSWLASKRYEKCCSRCTSSPIGKIQIFFSLTSFIWACLAENWPLKQELKSCLPKTKIFFYPTYSFILPKSKILLKSHFWIECLLYYYLKVVYERTGYNGVPTAH